MKNAAVIEGWALVRSGVETTLRRAGVATARSTTTATQFFSRLADDRGDIDEPIDLIVIGQVPDMTQTAAVRRAAELGRASVIVLAASVSPAAVMELCSDGAHAVVSREASESDLGDAIDAALLGRRYVAPDLLDAMFTSKVPMPARPRFDLTAREREVLAELAAGRTNPEISQRLLIGTETVKSHLTNIYDKLDVRRRSHAVSLALAAGLV